MKSPAARSASTPPRQADGIATGAMFGGFAGAFFATRQASSARNPSPSGIGAGAGDRGARRHGVTARRRAGGALTMIAASSYFAVLDQYRMLVFGLAMVLLMIWRPRGLIGHRAPTVFLQHSQAISSDLVKEGHG